MRNWPCVRCYYKSITLCLATCAWRAAASCTPPFTSTEAEHFSNCFEHELLLQSFTTVMSSCGVKGVIDIQYRAVSVSFQHCSYPGPAWWWPLRWKHEWYQISQNRKIHGCTTMEWRIFSRRKKNMFPGRASVTIYLTAQISPLDTSRRSNHCKLLYLSVLLMMFLSRTRSRLRLRRWLDSDWLRYYASYNSGSGHRHPSVMPASDWSDVTQARLWLVRRVPSLSVTPGATLAGDFTGDTGSDTQRLRQVKKV